MLPDQSAVYYPEELSLLGQILDQAVQSLPLSMRTPQNRAAIAKNILACAATGERDPIELGLAALIDLKVTVASALSEGFETPETGAQVERRLTQARDEAANAEHGAIRKDAGPVDLAPKNCSTLHYRNNTNPRPPQLTIEQDRP
jgi:hypothetical protein